MDHDKNRFHTGGFASDSNDCPATEVDISAGRRFQKRLRAALRDFSCRLLLFGIVIVWSAAGGAAALEERTRNKADKWPAVSQSLAGEARAGLYRGLSWLLEQQEEDGGWNLDPRSSALALIALANGGETVPVPTEQALKDGYRYLLSALEQIGKTNLEFKNDKPEVDTIALTMLALVRLEGQREADEAGRLLLKARKYMLQAQVMAPEKTGYGGFSPAPGAEPDLLTTQWALEALALTDYLELDPDDQEEIARLEKHYRSGLKFILDCQISSVEEGGNTKVTGSFYPSPRAVLDAEYRARLGPAEKDPILHTLAGLKFPLYLGLDQRQREPVDSGLKWLRERWREASLRETALAENLHETAFFLAQLLPMLEKTGIGGAGEVLKQWRIFTTASLLSQQRGSGEWQPAGGDEKEGASRGCSVTATAKSVLTILKALES